MKQSIALIIFFLFTNFYAQETDTIFYDESWKVSQNKDAFYYRVYNPKASKNNVSVKDYFITGEIQMTGTYKSTKFEKQLGEFSWFYKNGNKETTSFYENGKRDGVYKRWYNNKNVEKKGNYTKDKKTGKWQYFFENGQISAEITYKKDKIIKEKYWNDDGSKMTDLTKANYNAEFPNGNDAFNKYVFSLLTYPEDRIKSKTEGRVIVTFKINKKGVMDEYFIAQKSYKEFNQEALRIFDILKGTIWKPGKRYNRLVNTWYSIPINFNF